MADALHEKFFIEIQIRKQIGLRQKNRVRPLESQRIFVRFVASVRDADNQKPQTFADGKLRRADQVSHIFDEQNPRLWKFHGVHGIVHERRIEMTRAECIDLRRRDAFSAQRLRIDIRLDVPFDDIRFFVQMPKQTQKGRRLSHAGRAHDIHGPDAERRQIFPHVRGDVVVSSVNIFFDVGTHHVHFRFSYSSESISISTVSI